MAVALAFQVSLPAGGGKPGTNGGALALSLDLTRTCIPCKLEAGVGRIAERKHSQGPLTLGQPSAGRLETACP